jgi:hypothetical protein
LKLPHDDNTTPSSAKRNRFLNIMSDDLMVY